MMVDEERPTKACLFRLFLASPWEQRKNRLWWPGSRIEWRVSFLGFTVSSWEWSDSSHLEKQKCSFLWLPLGRSRLKGQEEGEASQYPLVQSAQHARSHTFTHCLQNPNMSNDNGWIAAFIKSHTATATQIKCKKWLFFIGCLWTFDKLYALNVLKR